MSVISYRKSLKDLNLLDSFLFSLATVDPNNAKLIARVIIRRVFGWNLTDIEVGTEKQYPGIGVGQNHSKKKQILSVINRCQSS